MLQQIKKLIKDSKQKTLDSLSLENQVYQMLRGEYAHLGGYAAFAGIIITLCAEEALQPVKASGTNGRKPVLYNRYRIVASGLEEESRLRLLGMHPVIKSEVYRKYPQAYSEDQKYLLQLDAFLKNSHLRESLREAISINERSFQIFQDEKFLLSQRGRIFLQRIGISLKDLSCYVTYEPFFYVDYRSIPSGPSPRDPNEDQDLNQVLPSHETPPKSYTALIVENKDTFYSIKRYWRADRRLLGDLEFDLLIYGEGRKIVASFAFVEEIQGLSTENLRVYYFGDLDPEGLDIFGALTAAFPLYKIEPFIYCYEELVRLHGQAAPKRRDKEQKLHPEYEEKFLELFPPPVRAEIQALIHTKRYIPQEGLSYLFFSKPKEVPPWEKN